MSKIFTNSSGTTVSTFEPDPWGGETNRNNNPDFQPFKYGSYYRDGIGSDDAMHRRYNRWWTRFEQPDPYDGSVNLTDPQSFNRYAYVQNDPVNVTDPTGLMPTICGVEFSFTDCGGSAGFWGGNFGGHVAEYNREFGGLPPNIAGALATHNQRVNDQLDANRANAAYRQWMATGRAEDYARFEAIMQNTNLVQVRVFSQAQMKALDLIAILFGQAIGDQVRFDAVAELTGLDAYYTSYEYDATNRTFKVNFTSDVGKFLANSPYFAGPGLALLHRDVGPFDYRSYTDMTGGLSLQVVPGRNGASGYADFDKDNPYQDLASFFRHNIPIIGRRLGRLF